MSLVPAVTELVLAELLYLQFEDQKKPIYMYINSTGTTKASLNPNPLIGDRSPSSMRHGSRAPRNDRLQDRPMSLLAEADASDFSACRAALQDGKKLGYDTEAFAIYDTMLYVKPPIHTICVGTAWGEAAMLLACGAKVGAPSTLPARRLSALSAPFPPVIWTAHRSSAAVAAPVIGHRAAHSPLPPLPPLQHHLSKVLPVVAHRPRLWCPLAL